MKTIKIFVLLLLALTLVGCQLTTATESPPEDGVLILECGEFQPQVDTEKERETLAYHYAMVLEDASQNDRIKFLLRADDINDDDLLAVETFVFDYLCTYDINIDESQFEYQPEEELLVAQK